MYLTPTELERLTIFTAAELARKRLTKGLLLNYPEAVALISDEILEGAREGRSVAEMMSLGSQVLTQSQVMPGVPAMLPMLQVEATFRDGTKLVTIHEPLRPTADTATQDGHEPGAIIAEEGDVELNAGRRKITLQAVNTGDRPIQIGSHYHFFEANSALEFDRAAAFGMHLDIAAGTAVRFEPGQDKIVSLVEFGGNQKLSGLNGLSDGLANDPAAKAAAIARARDLKFRGS
ncbi:MULTISPECIES: urease subunit gamma [unclassified Hyphomicrobium]|uniref:urease subunit gamma n=1 Tax=unclassified Hyphomicrobium TaxID=2619925 RepID=UPI000213E6D3|nr:MULTISPECIES: urease subunit gamma [unclassified Hyphomicrobium]CCB67147.1 urease gamma (N-terminal)/beta (C-terminal) subunit (urea amidohydrolase gamma/beta subunit) [Hyphomicrobium sp. MC1]